MLLMLTSAILALLFLPIPLYLGIIALAARRPKTEPTSAAPSSRFAVVIPAHNEQDGITATIESVQKVEYPSALYETIVVADNCDDKTEERAQRAGATVLERVSDTERGKGFALDHAFRHILGLEEPPDAVVVIDADTVVSPNILSACQAQLHKGEVAIQVEYGVRNPGASWRTRLIQVALALFHRTRSLARERLGVSAGLRGNGMCFSTQTLREHPHRAHGLVEDVEYGVELGLADIRIAFASDAWVLGEMVVGGKATVSQRRRWEDGRSLLVKQRLPTLLRQAFKRRSWMLFDLAMDLLVPPLSYVAIILALGLCVELVLFFLFKQVGWGAWVWLASTACLLAYVLRGVQHSGVGWLKGFGALAYAPLYVAWKLIIWRPRSWNKTWVRTDRMKDSP